MFCALICRRMIFLTAFKPKVGMARWLLSILLASWSLVGSDAGQCATGTALPGEALNVQGSLMANADVAFLKGYISGSLKICLEECCSADYGDCSVATYKKQASANESNCLHFNCRPVIKCKFMLSNNTDSFTFPALPSHHIFTTSTTRPTTRSSSDQRATTIALKDETKGSVTKEGLANFYEEQQDYKNDNTTIKPRKGVQENDVVRSGVKPRKGVLMEGLNNASSFINKSKVKARKGVEPYSTRLTSSSIVTSSSEVFHDINPTRSGHGNIVSTAVVDNELPVVDDEFPAIDNESSSDELLSDLKMVFEDDPEQQLLVSSELNSIPLVTLAASLSNVASFTDQNSFSSSVPVTTEDGGHYATYSKVKPSTVLHTHTDNAFVTPYLEHSLSPSILSNSENIKASIPSSIMLPSSLPDDSIHSLCSTNCDMQMHSTALVVPFSIIEPSLDTGAASVTESIKSSMEPEIQKSLVESYTMLEIPKPLFKSSTTPAVISEPFFETMTISDIRKPFVESSTVLDIHKPHVESSTKSDGSKPLSEYSTMLEIPHLPVEPSTTSTNLVHALHIADKGDEDAESEKERKYKASMHLVLSLVFGLLVLFGVIGMIAKRIYDSWLRRHYRRMDFLIDGMYNGYE